MIADISNKSKPNTSGILKKIVLNNKAMAKAPRTL
jgi:hypothetical protein